MFLRIVKYSIKNILRNTFLSISSLIVLTILMFFINTLFTLHNISLDLIDSINSKLTISLYLDDKYDSDTIEVIRFTNDIKQLDTRINVEYKGKERILDEMRTKEPELAKILEHTNPLPNTIVLSGIKLDMYAELHNLIQSRTFLMARNAEEGGHFADYNEQYRKITQLTHILRMLENGAYSVIGVFLIAIGIIIYSIIGNFIYYYRDEIYITRLV